jgi:hypothetical protein
MPQPLIPVPTVLFELDKFLLELEQHNKEVQAGVASIGEAAAYSLVWEFGNAEQTKEGPKTTRGYNVETGETVWLTIQRPYGYIRVNENLYWEILRDEMGKVTFSGNTASEINQELEACAVRVMKRIAKLLEETAPVDKGTLSDSFEVVEPGSNLLDEDADYVLDIG